MTVDGAIELPPEQPVAGRLDWSGDIKTLLLFVPLPQHRLDGRAEIAVRSEEHTSELQSLMRISYAVFCLKKKKQHSNIITTHDKIQTTVINRMHQSNTYTEKVTNTNDNT